jgi:hypothetical protein
VADLVRNSFTRQRSLATLDNRPILEILKHGIASAPPGRTMKWAFGAAHEAIDSDAHNPVPGTHRGRGTLRRHRAARVRDQRR